MKIELTKGFTRKLRNGTLVRIICTDAPGPYPIFSIDQNANAYSHLANGDSFSSVESNYDIMPETETVKFWVAHEVNTDCSDVTYFEKTADHWRASGRTVTGPHTAEIPK